ncbi:MAG: cellulose binding domain-containing protein [Herpetosiphonaceae bacterium]|nr:cellulose binding domain-containing protein [Herpetosiphonaceae bacterium]
MHRYPSWLSGLVLLSLLFVITVAQAAPAFTEQFDRDLATSPIFAWTSESALPRGTANVSAAQASDGKILRLQIGAGQPANPGNGANIISKQLYDYGTYEARLKTPTCPTSEGVISGFFTYFNDGSDSNGNGLPDNSEIDFEWLCAEPQSIYLTLWTDYNPSTEESRRVFRKINLASGTVEYTRYSTNFGGAFTDLAGSATEASPTTVAALPGYNSAAAYYEYGFSWSATSIVLWAINPASGQRIILWDYRGPSARISKVPAYAMANVWHTSAWAPECCPAALQPPSATRSLDIDWLRYSPVTSPTDTTPPSTPGGLSSPSKTSSSVSLSWAAATDNLGVTGYEVFQNGGSTPVATVGGASATVSGLNPSTSYSFTVRARDAAGNRSPLSAPLSVTTNPAPAGGLSATFGRYDDWGTGYVGIYRITNNGTAAVDGWALDIDLPATATIDSSWDSTRTRSGNHYTFRNVEWNRRIDPGQSREFGYTASYSGAWSAPSNCLINGQPCSGGPVVSNLALGRPALAASVEGSGLEAGRAVDGSGTSRWASAYSDPQWIRIDLGATRSISRVVLKWEAAYGRAYQIQTSADGSSWTPIYSTTTGDGGSDDLAVSGSGRYIRLYGTARGTQWGYSLWEFEVYGQ